MNLKTKKRDLVILAGGRGLRIKDYLNGQPKPMIKIKNVPFLSFIRILKLQNLNLDSMFYPLENRLLKYKITFDLIFK